MSDINIKVKILDENDLKHFVDLILLFEEVFEREGFTIPPSTHLERLLSDQDFIPCVAFLDEKIVGGLTVYVLHQYYSEKPLAYIYDLAVLEKYQRRGIGGKLIEAVKLYCKQNDFEEAFVQAEKVDDYALDFYRKTSPSSEEDAVHFSYLIK